jgi:hypothetical protein
MFSYINDFKETVNAASFTTVDIKRIDDVYVPLKETETDAQRGYISSIEGMKTIDFTDFKEIRQKSNLPLKTALIVNDNIMTRLFIGGISAIGLVALYKLLYRK